jgi:hypothetical protein
MTEQDSAASGRGVIRPSNAGGYVRWQVIAISAMFSILAFSISYFVGGSEADDSQSRITIVHRTDASDRAPARLTAAAPVVEYAATAAGSHPKEGQEEVCGLGFVQTDTQKPDAFAHIPDLLKRNAEQKAFNAMSSNPSERVQAAGLLLKERADQGDVTKVSRSADQLAQIARQSNDPVVYAIALEACDTQQAGTSTPGCDSLSATKWAQLEPTNAAPWLRLAQQAQANGDTSSLAEAVYRITQAKKIDWHANDAAMLTMQALPEDMDSLSRTVMMQKAWSAQVDWTPASYQGLLQFCELSGDVNRAQVCNDAAKLFVQAGTSPAELRAGIRIGQNIGWDTQRVEDLRLRRDVLSRAAANAPFYEHPYSCESVRELQNWFAAQQQAGELGAAQMLLQRSGQGLEPAVAALRHKRLERRTAVN